MEPAGGDGGSDASYESVASEGGYEPASDRGRDQLPRIISSSHCIEVFRRVRWVDGCFCQPMPEYNRRAKAAGRKEGPLRHDPLAGLPPRLLRFDGAVEAWLEELPLPRDVQHIARPYASLNDAAMRPHTSRADLSLLRAGNRRATVWYFTQEFVQQLWPFFLLADGSGPQLWEKALLERGCTIQSTHMELGQVHCPQTTSAKARNAWLKDLFAALQASEWTPNGEARPLLSSRRVSHASMAIGDVVQIGGELYVAGLAGFQLVQEGKRLLPQHSDSPEQIFEDYDFEPPMRGQLDLQVNGDKETQDSSSSVELNQSAAGDSVSGSGVRKRRNRKRRGRKGGQADQAGQGGPAEGGEQPNPCEKEAGGQRGGRGRGPKGKGRGGQSAGNADQEEVGHGTSTTKKGGKGKGRGKAGNAANGARQEEDTGGKEPRAKEPAPASDRVDRRKLRAQLQAQREKLQSA